MKHLYEVASVFVVLKTASPRFTLRLQSITLNPLRFAQSLVGRGFPWIGCTPILLDLRCPHAAARLRWPTALGRPREARAPPFFRRWTRL